MHFGPGVKGKSRASVADGGRSILGQSLSPWPILPSDIRDGGGNGTANLPCPLPPSKAVKAGRFTPTWVPSLLLTHGNCVTLTESLNPLRCLFPCLHKGSDGRSVFFAGLSCVCVCVSVCACALETLYNKMLKQRRNQILHEGWRTRLRLVSTKETVAQESRF